MRAGTRTLTALLLTALVGSGGVDAAVAGDHYDGSGASDAFEIVGNRAAAGGSNEVDNVDSAGSIAYIDYRWASTCGGVDVVGADAMALNCGAAETCTDPAARRWRLWGERPSQIWDPLGTECFSGTPDAADSPQPQITPGLVLTEIKRIGLPKLAVQIQPAGKTLVNFDTNFYVTPEPFTRTITLLGRSVEVEATPTEYTWLHGDGTSTSTAGPGAPYPDLTVTYAYPHVGTVAPSVQVTYSARFRVAGGAWQQIPETVTVAGPPGSLQVSEGTAVLSGEYR